jgi:hypothetical protein
MDQNKCLSPENGKRGRGRLYQSANICLLAAAEVALGDLKDEDEENASR